MVTVDVDRATADRQTDGHNRNAVGVSRGGGRRFERLREGGESLFFEVGLVRLLSVCHLDCWSDEHRVVVVLVLEW